MHTPNDSPRPAAHDPAAHEPAAHEPAAHEPAARSDAAHGTAERGAPRIGLGPLGILVRVVAAIAILFAAQFVSLPLMALIEGSPRLVELVSDPTWTALGLMTVVQGAVCTAAVLGVWIWVRFVERRPLADTGLRITPSSVIWLLLGTGIAAGLLFGVTALLPSTGTATGGELPFSAASVVISLLAVLVQGFVLQGFPEELLFRGMLISALRARPMLAIVVTTLAFTVIHLVSQGGQQNAFEHIVYLINPLGISLLAVGLLLWTRSMWAAVGVHGGFHLGNALSFAMLPEVAPMHAWIGVGTSCSVVGLVAIIAAVRRGRRIPTAPEWR